MIDATDPERAAEEVSPTLEATRRADAAGASPPPVAAQARMPARGRNDLWVVVETILAGDITLGSLELLSAAR